MPPTLSSKTEKWECIGEAHSLVTAKVFHFHVTVVLCTSATYCHWSCRGAERINNRQPDIPIQHYTCNVEKEKKGFNNGFSPKTFATGVKLKFKKNTHFNVIRPSMRIGVILTVLFPVDVVPDNTTYLHNIPIYTAW